MVAFNRRRIFTTPFFADMLAGVEGTLRHAGFSFSLVNYSPFENTQQQIADIAEAQYDGVIILATEMFESDFMPFASLDCPLLLLDSCMSAGVDTVKIDNAASMMLAVQYLHSKYGSVPGLLTTPVTVGNFTERRFAYEHATVSYRARKSAAPSTSSPSLQTRHTPACSTLLIRANPSPKTTSLSLTI